MGRGQPTGTARASPARAARPVLQIPRLYGEEKLEFGVHPPSLAPAGLQSRSRGGNVSVLTVNTNNGFKY